MRKIRVLNVKINKAEFLNLSIMLNIEKEKTSKKILIDVTLSGSRHFCGAFVC